MMATSMSASPASSAMSIGGAPLGAGAGLVGSGEGATVTIGGGGGAIPALACGAVPGLEGDAVTRTGVRTPAPVGVWTTAGPFPPPAAAPG